MIARVFTDQGVEAFRTLLGEFRSGMEGPVPASLTQSSELTVELAFRIELPSLSPQTTRYLWGQAIDGLLGSQEPPPNQRRGFWTWLSAHYFDAICPAKDGKRQVREEPRYIPELGNYRRFYRHLLLGPWYVARAHRTDPVPTKVVLAGPLSAPGELPAQLMSRQDLITSAAVLRAAYVMYFDDKAGRLRRGSGGSGPGSPRRLADVLAQLALTYDLHAIDHGSLLALLPKEFERFLGH